MSQLCHVLRIMDHCCHAMQPQLTRPATRVQEVQAQDETREAAFTATLVNSLSRSLHAFLQVEHS